MTIVYAATNKIEMLIRGIPVPQGRPRFFVQRGHIGAKDPEKSKGWKETVRWQAIEQGARPLDGPLSLYLRFFLPRPKSLPKKILDHTKKPDLDNMVKAIKDALKGICYRDDSQIVRLLATKEYGEVPGVKISIRVAGREELEELLEELKGGSPE